jgi:hypothetical protein
MASLEPETSTSKARPGALRRLGNIASIVAFVALCAFYVSEVVRATRQSEAAAAGGTWVCPIAGKCGPAGTPGLGRW